MLRSSCSALRHGIAGAIVVAGAISGFTSTSHAQDANVNGMRESEVRTHAIVGATVVVRPGEVLEDATIVMRRGVIEAVGTDITPPDDARIWDGGDMTVYPGFIDAAILVDVESNIDSAGAHWNDRVTPQVNVVDAATPSSAIRSQLRNIGFTAAAFYPSNGIFRGTGAVLALGDAERHVTSYRDHTAMMMAFDYGGRGRGGGYPGSLMGSHALIRQTLHDAQWHQQSRDVYGDNPRGNEPPIRADALAALEQVINGEQPVLWETSDELMQLRAARIASEFNLDLALLGNGYEFRRLGAIAELDCPVILPLNFPDAPDVTTLHQADNVTLRTMQTWEQAPTNPRRLHDAGVTIALTTHALRSKSAFHGAVRNAIKHGLSEDDALAAMTTVPAAMLGLDEVMGTIEAGKLANLVVVEGSIFDKKGKVRDTWIDGRRYEISSDDATRYDSRGELTVDGTDRFDVTINAEKKTVTFTLPAEADDDADDDTPAKPRSLKAKKVIVQRDQMSWVIDGEPFDVEGYVRFSGVIMDETLVGSGSLPDGTRIAFNFRPFTEDELDALDDADAEEDGEGERVAAEDAGDDGDAPASAVDGLWALELDIPEAPEPVIIELDLTLQEDGSVAGSMSFMGQPQALDGGSWDPATGVLLFERDMNGMRSMLRGTVTGNSITGTAQQGEMVTSFSGSRAGGAVMTADAGDDDSDDGDFEMPPAELSTPLGAYGRDGLPEIETVLVRNATIWTSGPDGIIEGGDLLVRNGSIEYVGPSRDWPNLRNTRVIDGTGKHVTPGLIDCHSHTGITGGVNEFSEANTAEVRIGDCINPDDIDWYRQLAGGLTAANQLHGSANPIGGQNSVVKLKWGGDAEDFSVDEALPGIKFALGENVVRSQDRYPNTRMGVETYYLDAFTTAQEYETEWKRYNALSNADKQRTMPPRRDMELDTLVEILNGERIIHCHSYRQDEILMLIRVAERFGFTIGTFQHILEGYKVADEIAAHGAGGSSFSDWWGYKVEVMDAIPHNGTLMTRVGVLMSFNSDSDELARRMNLEAAKAVRYGGLDPAEALKLVTINPAMQLRIHERTGSLEQGKDGDFAIWSDNPLSNYARCEQTWIEGARYYSLDEHRAMSAAVDADRRRLIQKILAESHGTAPSMESDDDDARFAAAPPMPRAWQWMVDDARQWMIEQVRLGADPEEVRPGECGCNDFILHLMQSEVRR